MKLNQLLISTAVLGAAFGAGNLMQQSTAHADTVNQNNVPTQSAANVAAGVSSAPQSQAPASAPTVAPQSSTQVATQSAPQTAPSSSATPVSANVPTSAPQSDTATVTPAATQQAPQSVTTSASTEANTSVSNDTPQTSSYDYSNNIPPQNTIKVAHVVKTHRSHNYYDEQISKANTNMSNLINNIPTYGATHRSHKSRKVVTPRVNSRANGQSQQTVDTSNIQNNIPTNVTTTTQQSQPKVTTQANTQSQSQLSESGYPTLPAGVSPSAYNWTDARTESGESPWETTSQGVNLHQTLHNGNQIYYNNAGTGVDYQAFNDAVNNWNRLGVIQLVPTDAANAQITLSNDDDPQDDGHSNYGITYGYSSADGTMSGYHSYLDRATDSSSYQEKVNTATHELGHSLGFAHDMSRYYDEAGSGHFSNHIMMSGQTDATLPLSTKEANALREHYGL